MEETTETLDSHIAPAVIHKTYVYTSPITNGKKRLASELPKDSPEDARTKSRRLIEAAKQLCENWRD